MIRFTYILLRSILTLTLISLGCGTESSPNNPEYEYGSDLSIRIPLSKTVAAQIARAELIVYAGGEILMTEELVVDGEAITGTIKEVPAGGGRRFTINAYDQQGVIIYSGFSVATVIANDTITVPVTLMPVSRSGSAIKGDIDLPLPNGVSMSFVLVEAGRCLVGSTPSEVGHQPKEAPATSVDIPYDYYVGIVEVTEEQWVTVMNTTLWEGDFNPDSPARNMNWYEASAFVLEVNSWNGENLVRLPSEVEWECASRAGTESRWSFGNSQAELADYAWYEANSAGVPGKVGQKLPNQWGAFDMPGNVQEWTLSSFLGDYPPVVFTTFEDGFGLENPASPVARGGSYASSGTDTRSAARNYAGRGSRANTIGFRLVMKVRNNTKETDSGGTEPIMSAEVVGSPTMVRGRVDYLGDPWRTNSYGEAVRVRGEIRNTGDIVITGLQIRLILRDAAGNLVARVDEVSTVPESIPLGDTAVFEAVFDAIYGYTDPDRTLTVDVEFPNLEQGDPNVEVPEEPTVGTEESIGEPTLVVSQTGTILKPDCCNDNGTSVVTFEVANAGTGDATNVTLALRSRNDSGGAISDSDVNIGTIAKGASALVRARFGGTTWRRSRVSNSVGSVTYVLSYDEGSNITGSIRITD